MYPENSEVFLTIIDFQLNQDPTDEDSWTFNVNSSSSVFYQALDENGFDSSNGGAGLVDLTSFLSSLGFEDNGELLVNVGNILELQSNDKQPTTNVSDGTQTFSKILTFVENGPNSGIFEDVFKMPSQICNKSGTELISSAGGSLDAKYFDSRDSSGNANTFSLLREKSATSFYTFPQLSSYEIIRPLSGDIEDITLSGNLENHRRGIPLSVTIVYPDGKSQSFASILSNGGNYKSIISINENSPIGLYKIELSHNNSDVGTLSLNVKTPELPVWVKNNAKWWSEDQISDDDLKSIQYLVKKGIIRI